MKKFNYLILGAAGLLLASCSQDDILPGLSGDGNYNVTVKLPDDMATRAVGDGLTADMLRIAVYDADNNNTFVFDDVASFGGNIQTTVSLNLPQGKSYNIAFFAVSEEADGKLYTFNCTADEPNITVDYSQYLSNPNLADDYDCFYNFHNTGTITGATSQSVTLTRPVAQINWGTSDLSQAVVDEQAFGEGGKYIVSNFTITGDVYTQFSLFNSEVTGDPTTEPVLIPALASPAATAESAAWDFPVDPATYKYIAMQYVLAPVKQALYTLNLDVHNTQGTIDNEDVNVANAPVQANYQTNIYGALLTNPNEFTVIKDQNWAGTYDPSLALAVKRGGYFKLQDDVTLDSPLVVNTNFTLDLNGHTITNNMASDQGTFYVPAGGNLTITGEGTMKTNNQTEPYQGEEYPICIHVWVDGGTATIEGGYYEAPGPGQLIYCEKGEIYVKGGTYNLKGTKLDAYQYYPLNCYDANYKNGTANIYVSGGTYYNFNPGDNNAEGANKHTSFLVDGYDSVQTTVGDDTLYTVVKAGTLIANDVSSLQDALNKVQENGTVLVQAGTYDTFPGNSKLPEGVTIECEPGTEFTGANSSVNLNGATVKGATFNYTTRTSNDGSIKGTINANFEDCTFTGGNGARWTYAGASEITFTNCDFGGTAIYAFHIDGLASGISQSTLVFNDCDFDGFLAIAGAVDSEYNNCNFAINKTSNYGGGNFWGSATFNNCQFYLPDPTVDFQYIALATAGKTYIFNNCYNEGEAITVNFPFDGSKGVTVTVDGQSKTFN
ncbi:MAG: hypothetical protein J1F07_08060 [Muribaculaceae bacterium]|nr:hypothetical protein [Muribaculaceae bacterium]